MAKEIGRLHSFGIGTESPAGTAGTIDAWIPLESGDLAPKAEVIKDVSGIGVIAENMDAHISKVWSEFTAKGVVRPTSFGWLLWGLLGTQPSAPALVETGVYKHSFVLGNNNNHQSFTIVHDSQTQEEQGTYNMIDSLGIVGEVGSYAKFDLKMKGKLFANTTGNTPTFLSTGDTPFVMSKATVKFATDIAGLGAASKVAVQSFKITFDKKLEQIFSTMSSTTDAVDFASQHNTTFTIKGDMEIVYDTDTYKTLFTAGTKQAMQIMLEGKTLLGATKYEAVDIQLASVVLEDWGRKIDNNNIVKQSFGFTALYKLGETKIATIDLSNAKATQYA